MSHIYTSNLVLAGILDKGTWEDKGKVGSGFGTVGCTRRNIKFRGGLLGIKCPRRSYLRIFNKWYQSLVKSFNQQKNKIQAHQKKKIMKKSSSSENKPCRSKGCKKNTDNLNSKITELSDKLDDKVNMIYHYSLGLSQVEGRLVDQKERELKYLEKIRTLEYYNESYKECIETLKKKLETLQQEKEGVDGKLTGLLTASKDLDNLIESQISDKNKEGLGYNVVPPPIAQIYSSPKKDLSWTGLSEFADDTITDYSSPSPAIESILNDAQNKNPSVTETGASDSTILSKPTIKFVKAVNRAAKRSTTTKVKAVKKSSMRYAELYRKPLKKPNVRGNQRNWNNLKSHQLGPNFMKNKACFNCGDFNHLAYDCIKRVKKGTSRSQNKTHESFTPKPFIDRPFGPPVRPMRSNMNCAGPNTTSFNKQAHLYANRPLQRTSTKASHCVNSSAGATHQLSSGNISSLAVATILHYQWQNNSSSGNSAVGMIFTNNVVFGPAPFIFDLIGLTGGPKVISKMIKVTIVKACLILHDKSLAYLIEDFFTALTLVVVDLFAALLTAFTNLIAGLDKIVLSDAPVSVTEGFLF
nr:ribonuclease H-like domain-containing protein [Tanacetum cinerariifolium]